MGRVVIPKPIREELGLQPGSKLEVERDGDAVRIVPAGARAIRGPRGRYSSSGLAAAPLADRARERG